jgi:uncharacterized protein YceH (UPF0502 family)
LRQRTERLHEFANLDEVEVVLRQLSEAGMVQLLERLHGQKEARWQQLLAEEIEVQVAAPVISSESVKGSVSDRVTELEARVARLEAALGDLLPPSDDDEPTTAD